MQFDLESKLLPDYTEYGVEKGAKIADAEIDNIDIPRIFNATRSMDLNESLAWLESHTYEFDSSTIIVDTDDGNSLTQYRNLEPKVFILKPRLNHILHLNTLLNKANEELQSSGYLWCHCRTSALKKEYILKRYFVGLNWIIYILHYFWHRVMPKLSFTQSLYFALTKGTRRSFSRVEILGRLYRAGFEVIDERFRFGEFFVLARKSKVPIWNDNPSSSPIIRLKRIGKSGKIIDVYKFRTMFSYSEYLQPYLYKHNALAEGGKFADDYRVNLWGKILRKMWLDELPMVINLIKGDIKLVGVRPLSLHYFSLYSQEIQELRIKVKPGLLPPFYYEKKTPQTIEEVQESEYRYLKAYLQKPFLTDWEYFWMILCNILFHGRRSK